MWRLVSGEIDKDKEYKRPHCFEFIQRKKRRDGVGGGGGIMFQVMWSGLFWLWDTVGWGSGEKGEKERKRK